jgi:hypothetical protein
MLAHAMHASTSPQAGGSRLLLIALALLGGSACGHFDEVAGVIAHAQGLGSSIARQSAGLAHQLCREGATYAYFEMMLGIGQHGPVAKPAAFSAWYAVEEAARDPAGQSQSWQQYCDELRQTGPIYDGALVALWDYTRALEELARGEKFDGSGLEKLGGSIASIANTLAPKTSIGSAAKTSGAVAKKLAEVVVGVARRRQLKKLVLRAAPHVTAVSNALRDYLGGLEAERELALHRRQLVLRAVDARRDVSGAFTPAAQAALAFDLSNDAEERLGRYERQLAHDRALLLEIARVHATLAAAAVNSDCERQARAAAAQLLRSFQVGDEER